jgi:6-pyruvoyltetrahydropterin/6-carboxytetrahydropterin synthase
MKYKIIKEFGPYPYAHMQHRHDGHCSYLHGHNAIVRVHLESNELDTNGFVYDFGKMRALHEYLTSLLDHTLLLNIADYDGTNALKNAQQFFSDAGVPRKVADIRMVANASAESLAEAIFMRITEGSVLPSYTGCAQWQCSAVEFHEDSKNIAIYQGVNQI